MVRLIVLDVEGVLVLPGGSQHPWSLEEMLQVRRFLASAPAACILCSGRQEPYGEAVVQALDLFGPLPDGIRSRARETAGVELLGWPSILENGGYFYDALAKRAFPHPALTPSRVESLRRLRLEVIEPLTAQTGAQIEAGKDFCISLNPPPVAPGSRERQPADAFRREVEAAAAAFLETIEIKHSASAVDITPCGVSKASALRLVLEWTGLAPEEVLGVGDTAADEAWLAEAGWRAAPANGRAALPGMDYYSPHEVTAGLLDILRRLQERSYRGL